MPVDACAVVLAAGAGARLGGVAKALLPAGATSFLGAIAATLAEAGVGAGRVVVVVGEPHGAAVAAEAARLGLACVVNPEPGRGMASSVAVGFADADVRFPDAIVGLLWPVDHARVGAAAVRAVIAAVAAGAAAAIPTWDGRGGHPVAVARPLWPALAAATELPDGARGVLRPRAVRIPVADPAVVADVDTWADAAAARGAP